MIDLNDKTQQDFLNEKWVQKLLDAGVDMSDAKYYIVSLRIGSAFKTRDNIKVALKEELSWIKDMPGCLPALEYNWGCPTYTVSELFNKLKDYIHVTKDNKQFTGALCLIVDGAYPPHYYSSYYAHQTPDFDWEKWQDYYNKEYLMAEYEYPIYALAALLIQCHQKGI